MPTHSPSRSMVSGPLRKVLTCYLGWLAMGLVGPTSLPSMAQDSPAKLPSQPNVLLIISDDQGWGDYGFMGHSQLKTPHLDRLAAESLTFRRAYVPSSLCCPSLASIITGRYPHQHGITCNDPPIPPGTKPGGFYSTEAYRNGRAQLAEMMTRQATLPRWLGAVGYQSLQTGKWWQNDFRTGGFTAGMTKGERHGDAGLEIGRKTLEPIFEFIRECQARDKPFFVWYAPFLPHAPHDAPEDLVAASRSTWKPGDEEAMGPYFANVLWHDRAVGELLGGLRQLNCDQNTIVIYVTDNGWIPGAKRNSYAPKSKQSPYEGGLRTPLMIRWPGHVEPRFEDTPVSSVDIAPTVLKACGVPVPTDLPGVDLLDPIQVAARSTIFGECHTHNAVDLNRPASGLRWRWAIAGRWKLIAPAPQNELDKAPELYDLVDDPGENRNLATAQPERLAKMQRLLDTWWNGND
ncbi:MAG: sulfatase [Planctomycetota bacterium]|jgi:arylsulfatase A-like enzyme